MSTHELDLFDHVAWSAAKMSEGLFTEPDDDWVPILFLEDTDGERMTMPIEQFMTDDRTKDMLAEYIIPSVIEKFSAKIAVMGPEAAINAVYANKIAEINDEAERIAYVERLRKEYEIDIDIMRLASELIVDAIVEPREVRRELVARFAAAATKDRHFSTRRHGIPPV